MISSVRHFAFALALAASPAALAAEPLVLSDELIVGTWECGPTTMRGANFDLVVSTRTVNLADHTSTTVTTSVVTPHGARPVTSVDEIVASWRVEGDILTTEVKSARFVTSSDITVSQEEGQRLLDAQMAKKSVYQSRVLSIDAESMRSIPHNSMFKEAAVESVCKRVPAQ